jgi:hypothetical protein
MNKFLLMHFAIIKNVATGSNMDPVLLAGLKASSKVVLKTKGVTPVQINRARFLNLWQSFSHHLLLTPWSFLK